MPLNATLYGRNMKLLASVIVSILIAGCSDRLDVQVNGLINGKNTWLSFAGQRSYSYEFVMDCYCFYHGEKIIINSEHDHVVSAKLENGEKVSSSNIRTMKGLFEHVFSVIKRQQEGESISLKVEYNKEYGYPELISVDRWAIHGSYKLHVSNVKLIGHGDGI